MEKQLRGLHGLHGLRGLRGLPALLAAHFALAASGFCCGFQESGQAVPGGVSLCLFCAGCVGLLGTVHSSRQVEEPSSASFCETFLLHGLSFYFWDSE